MSIINYLFYRLYNIIITGYSDYLKSKLGKCGKNVEFFFPAHCVRPELVFLENDTNIYSGFTFISSGGKFIMKNKSGAAQGLTVITGNHQRKGGNFLKDYSASHMYDVEKDIVVEEDVWIGANVTLLAGVVVGRGATVGAGSVCDKSVPPYAVVMGNPAKVLGFNYTPEEIIEHEKALYPESERLSRDVLVKNYEKFFISRIKEIKQFTKF